MFNRSEWAGAPQFENTRGVSYNSILKGGQVKRRNLYMYIYIDIYT